MSSSKLKRDTQEPVVVNPFFRWSKGTMQGSVELTTGHGQVSQYEISFAALRVAPTIRTMLFSHGHFYISNELHLIASMFKNARFVGATRRAALADLVFAHARWSNL